jgi:lysyl-tRNA synthetase class I
VVELIGATTTKTGLKVESALDTRSYQKGIKVSNAAMKCLDITAISSILNGTTQSGHGTRRIRSSYCSECPKLKYAARSSISRPIETPAI